MRGFTIVALAAATMLTAPALAAYTATLSNDAGVISAGVEGSGLSGGIFTHLFFTPTSTGGQYISVPVGEFTGSLTTTTNAIGSATDFDFISVALINAANSSIRYGFDLESFASGRGQTASIFTSTLFPAGITAGDYYLEVVGTARGNGSYGGQITFNPAPTPEPATWAMATIGFGLIGATMRRRRIRIAFA